MIIAHWDVPCRLCDGDYLSLLFPSQLWMMQGQLEEHQGRLEVAREAYNKAVSWSHCDMSGATTPYLVFKAIVFRIPLIKSYVSDS